MLLKNLDRYVIGDGKKVFDVGDPEVLSSPTGKWVQFNDVAKIFPNQQKKGSVYVVKICTENQAFEDNCGSEIARILRKLANQIEDTGACTSKNLYDINGNKVGSAITETF